MAVCSWCRGEMSTVNSCSMFALHRRAQSVPLAAFDGPRSRCGDCNVARGGFHHPGCDLQRCPVCGGQMVSCGCRFDEDGPGCDGSCDECDVREPDVGLWQECDCDLCSRGLDDAAFDAVISALLTRLEIQRALGRAFVAEPDGVEKSLASALANAELVGVEASGQIVMRSTIAGEEITVRHGRYPDCDVMIVNGFLFTTPLRSLIDRAPYMTPAELHDELCSYLDRRFITPALAWQRLGEPDMQNNEGAEMVRRLLPPTPRS